MNKFLLAILFFLSLHVSAQYQSSNWYFGIQAAISFSTNPPTALTGGQLNQSEGCCSISDAGGNLLFYSDGLTVWDATNTVMPNGTGLLGGQSSTQSSIVVQDPGDSSKYYLITAPQESTGNPLAYSIIDMTLNGGKGDVTATKNVPLMSNVCEKVTAVYKDNGVDVWIVGHEFGNNNFIAYSLTASGISNTPVVSSVGSDYSGSDNNTIGYLKASPCGNKLAAAVWQDDFLELYDFDNATGIVSHAVHLGTFFASSGVYGVEFSPNDTKLYASIITPGIVIQYDLSAGTDQDIINSADTIGTSPVNFNGALQTGPDAKIYLVKLGSNTLDCILKPNELGSSCGYTQDYVSLGSGQGQLGLPDFFSSFFCNIIGVNEVNNEISISLFPNPAQDVIQLELNNVDLTDAFTLRIFNSIGQCMYSSVMNSNLTSPTTLNIPLRGWSKGVYFVSLTSQKKSFSQEFTKM